MELTSWGRYPRVDARIDWPRSTSEAKHVILQSEDLGPITTRGIGRSYGDSSLGNRVLDLSMMNNLVAFDDATGDLTCQAGVTLDEILRWAVPKGWFLPVTPGTKFVTVGGAIASDVHGKNHHAEGTFCEHVTRMSILLGNGDLVEVSASKNPDLFHATCGGMGLTGVIVEATLRMKRIKSAFIDETTYKCGNIEEVLDRFGETMSSTYSVAWIDCLATGGKLGRSLLMVGEHSLDGDLRTHGTQSIRVPVDAPLVAMNRYTMSAFNAVYYHKAVHKVHSKHVPYDPFFYPLDKVIDWNRLYGKNGFTQYQFVLPLSAGKQGLKDVLSRIAESGRGSMLAVLKVFGKANENLLSFPFEGYTLALDFKADGHSFELLDELDKVVAGYGGRLYLTKDARMSIDMFRISYPNWEEFERVREKYHAVGSFSSLQASRLGLQ